MENEPVFIVKSEEDVLTVVGTGRSAAFYGDEEKIKVAKAAADAGVVVRLIPGVRKFTAGWDTEEGILAALLATAPGRCFVQSLPAALLEEIYSLAEPRAGEVY